MDRPFYTAGGGKNRSLEHIIHDIQSESIQFDYFASSSPHLFLFSLIKNVISNRIHKYDFIIFNSLASIDYVNVYGIQTSIGSFLLKSFLRFDIPIYFYWHETDWVFSRLAKRRPNLLVYINQICHNFFVFHLTASKAASKNILKYFPNSTPFEVYECTKVGSFTNENVINRYVPFVVNVASIQLRKGVDLFIETAISVFQSNSDIHFIWIGDGKLRKECVGKIHSLGLAERIHFIGYQKCPWAWIDAADVFFMTSRDDPFPLSVLEAMALEKTIVAFDVGGIAEALGGHGTLIPSLDTELASKAILHHLSLSAHERRVPVARARYSKHFTPDKLAVRMAHAIRDGIARSRKR